MGTLDRIEAAEEELRLAKLELECEDIHRAFKRAVLDLPQEYDTKASSGLKEEINMVPKNYTFHLNGFLVHKLPELGYTLVSINGSSYSRPTFRFRKL